MSIARQFSRSVPAAEMYRRRRARPVVPGLFEVIGRDGRTRYQVAFDEAGEATCTCIAGQHGQPCYHAAAALRWLVRRGLEVA